MPAASFLQGRERLARLESELGAGSTFTFTIPVIPRAS